MEPRGSIATDQLSDKVDEDESRRDDARRHGQARAPKSAGDLTMGRHARIVDHLFEVDDPMEVYERVRAGLSFGGRASSLGHGELVDALDEAQTLATEASRLSANMKVALRAFELDAEVIRGALRNQATADIRDQITAGTFAKKTINNDDIEAVMAQKFSDEYRDLELRHSRAKRAADAIESLAERAVDRARDLRAMVSSSRST